MQRHKQYFILYIIYVIVKCTFLFLLVATNLFRNREYKSNSFIQICIKFFSGKKPFIKTQKMKLSIFATMFSFTASFTISAVSHRSAIENRIAQTLLAQANARSSSNVVAMGKYAEIFSRFNVKRKKNSKINKTKNSRLLRFRKFHRKNRF